MILQTDKPDGSWPFTIQMFTAKKEAIKKIIKYGPQECKFWYIHVLILHTGPYKYHNLLTTYTETKK